MNRLKWIELCIINNGNYIKNVIDLYSNLIEYRWNIDLLKIYIFAYVSWL